MSFFSLLLLLMWCLVLAHFPAAVATADCANCASLCMSLSPFI
jgi:hypothetical protein